MVWVLMPVWKSRCSTNSIGTAELHFLPFAGDEECQALNDPKNSESIIPPDMYPSLRREPTMSDPLPPFRPFVSLAASSQAEIQTDLVLPKPKRCGRCGIC